MLIQLFLIILTAFPYLFLPLKASAIKEIALLSEPSLKFQKVKYYENKKILNSKKRSFKTIKKTALLWDIPMKNLILRELDEFEEEKRKFDVYQFMFQQKLRRDIYLEEAYKYSAKSLFSRIIRKGFNNPHKFTIEKANTVLLEVREDLEQDLQRYLSYFSRDLVKSKKQHFPDYQNFLEMEKLIIENYGIASINFINHHYSIYPKYFHA